MFKEDGLIPTGWVTALGVWGPFGRAELHHFVIFASDAIELPQSWLSHPCHLHLEPFSPPVTQETLWYF